MQDITKSDLYREEDYNRGLFFYNLYRKSLERILDFRQFDSFADVGCANGRLLESVYRKYPHLRVKGYDMFEWAKKYASPSIKSSIELCDLRQPIPTAEQFGLVNCTEVGEHIEREYESVFLDNLAAVSAYVLILSWSAEENPQHFNPRPVNYVIQQMAKRGFVVDWLATRALRRALRDLVSPHGFQWWAEDAVVYVRKIQNTFPKYIIWSSRNQEGGAIARYSRLSFLTPRAFQQLFLALTKFILERVALGAAASIARISDGDLYFLRKRAVGSASPGRRGSLLPFEKINISKYRFGFLQNDVLSFSPELPNRRHVLWYCFWHPPFLLKQFLRRLIKIGDRSTLKTVKNFCLMVCENIVGPSAPHEVIYSLVATRWIFRAFPDQIGLIGNEHKMELIKRLMKHKEYREYLGINSFTDYIAVPQKGAADYPEKLIESIADKISGSRAKIFLVGMGHAKTAVLWQLKNYSDAVFIDVGTGIDALAGCVCQERPQFGDWINFRFKDYDYGKIDQMDYDQPFWDKSKYKTVWL